jgi:mRNA interferase RelE/StbE
MNLDLSKRANDFLQQLPPKQFKQVVSAIFSLLNNPKPVDAKLLMGYDKLYRKDIGEFRIIYRYFQETERVFIVLVGKRNDDEVYKLLRRLI